MRPAKDPTPERQLALDLPHRPALGRSDFLVAPSNAAAVAWIDRWPDWPGPGLVLFGPEGAGKSHLAAVWRARSGAVSVSLAEVAARRLEVRYCHVECPEPAAGDNTTSEAPQLGDRTTAEALFHLYNRIAAARGHLLVTARRAPARWSVVLPDLASRLRALPAVAIEPPDDAMLAGLFAKLFRDRQLVVGDDVILYLVARVERSCAAAGAAVERLDRASLARQRPITLPFVREILNL